MLVKLIGVPSLSALKFRLLADELGLSYLLIKDDNVGAPGRRYKIIKNKSPSYFSAVKVAFAASELAYSATSRRLAGANTPYLVFVCANPVVLAENHIFMLNTFEISTNVYTTVDVTGVDLLASIIAANSLYANSVPFDSPFELTHQHKAAYTIFTDIINAGALHLVQSLFYNIKDKTHREEVKNAVFLYISGSTKRIGRAGEFSSIVENLSSDPIQRLRAACIFAQNRSIDEAVLRYRVDRFEVSYVLSRISAIDKAS